MPEPRGLRSRFIAIALIASLNVLTLAGPAFADDTARSASGGGDDKTAAAAPARAGDSTKDASKTATTDAGDASHATPGANAALVTELQQLKDTVQAQAQRLVEHTQELESERAALHDELDRIAKLEAALNVTPGAPKANPESVPAGSAVASLSATATSAVPPPDAGTFHVPDPQSQSRQKVSITQPEHPLSFKIGSADFTPGGFADLTGVFRSTNTGTGLGTNFASIPFNTTVPQSQLTEFRVTSQASRLSLKVDAKVNDSTSVTGYVESDFNGYLPPNAEQSTNSDTFRLRLAYADIRHNKWEVVGGQTWSLLTPNRYEASAAPIDVFSTLRADTNYVAGLVFARQAGVRLTYHANDWWTLSASLENPEQYVPGSVVFPGGATGIFPPQFDNGSGSTSAASSGTNALTPNLRPDVIAKSAFDWNLGEKHFHVEVAGISRSFKVYENLNAPASTNTINGGGGSVNLNLELLRGFHLIANTFYGDGVGRYIGGLGPDVIVKADGTLSGVHAGSGVAGFEWQVKPNFLLDGYYSGAYFKRNYSLLASTVTPTPTCNGVSGFTCVGFGFPGSANTNNREYQEATIGFVPTLWSSPNYGKLQLINQYGYVERSPWSVPGGAPKNAHVVLVYMALRYIIP
jgi:hypothetical protein